MVTRKPPPEIPLSRDEWTLEFAAELAKLRPHLLTQGGVPNRMAHALALEKFDPAADPIEAAQAYHQAASR